MPEQTHESIPVFEPATWSQSHVAVRKGRLGPLRIVLLALVFWAVQLSGAAEQFGLESETPREVDSYTRELNERLARERQEQFQRRVAIPDAVGEEVPSAIPPLPSTPTIAAQTEELVSSDGFVMGAGVFFLGVILFLRLFAPRFFDAINRRINPWAFVPSKVTAFSTRVRAEEEAFTEFFSKFQGSVAASVAASSKSETAAAQLGQDSSDAVATDEDFYAAAPQLVTAQQKLLQDITRALDDAARQKGLAKLRDEVQAFKGKASGPKLLLVRQVATAVEGLLSQLAEKARNVTASTLRTVTSGVDLLADLSVPDVKPDLLTSRPLRFLAVDDDLVSRNALCLALKKALTEPDVAVDGKSGLALAEQHSYDVIFLDVQMPGMDGFELCSKIHETACNRTASVVFITVNSDFDARCRSILSGGNDLLGKPFLTFEVAVKALTLALRGRIQANTPEEVFAAAEADLEAGKDTSWAIEEPQAEAEAEIVTTAADNVQSDPPGTETERLDIPDDTDWQPGSRLPDSVSAEDLVISSEAPSDEFADDFLASASTQLEPLRDLFQAMLQTAEEGERQELLAEAYVRLHSFAPKTALKATHPVIPMSTALQGLLRKLLQDPANATPSTLVSAAAGVDLLIDLCVPGLRPDLITNPPIRMLVVDDDAVARSALANALQMAFEKPDTADNGETALALAAQKRFDVIFLDVQMPGMDGFAVCSGIRETVLNKVTPVVFVAVHSDFSIRSRMSLSGGSDCIGKPFLTSEITVKAMTFALRGRLNESIPARV